jgi:hypothetical protein
MRRAIVTVVGTALVVASIVLGGLGLWGKPGGAISMSDVIACLAQTGKACPAKGAK